MKNLCTNCKYLKSRKIGPISCIYWCSKTGNGWDGKALGVRPWINKPHPKCPLNNTDTTKNKFLERKNNNKRN